MLFKFGKFWKTLSLILGSWVFYGIWEDGAEKEPLEDPEADAPVVKVE